MGQSILSRITSVCLLALLISAPMGAQGWQQLRGGLPAFIAISAVDTGTCWFGGDRAFVVRVVNGTTIQWKDAGIEPGEVSAIFARSASLAWVGTADGKIYKTTDGGSTWTKQFQHSAGAAAFFNGLHFWDDNIGVAIGDPISYPNLAPPLIMRTTNGGTTWTEITSGVPSIANQFGVTMRFDAAGNNLWFATAMFSSDTLVSRVIYRTRDKGLTWDTLSIPQYFGDFDVSFSDTLNGLITGSFSKIARTTDGGNTWSLQRNGVGLGPLRMHKGSGVGYLQGYFDAQLGYAPIYRTTDFGQSWTKQTKPVPFGVTGFQVVDQNYAWACGVTYLILRTRSGGIATSVGSDNGSQFVPLTLELSQNYPNPFNPVTTIKYRLFKSGETRLVIYDQLGRAVRTLVNGEQREGWHIVLWDGTDDGRHPVSTGVYYYRIESAGQADTKKMIFLK